MPRARLNRPRVLLAAFATLAATLPLALVACAPTPAAPAALPDGLSALIQQGRMDIEARQLVVRVENTGAAGLDIERLAFAAPALVGETTHDEPFTLDAGEAIQIRVDLPESRCDVEAGVGSVRLAVAAPDGTVTGELTPDDPFDTLRRLNDGDCLAESVAAVAAITMPEHLRSTGSGADRRAVIDVLVEPVAAGSASMTLQHVFGTTLLGNETGADWPLDLEVAAGDGAFTIELPVRPARCDAHGIADDKRGTILAFEITASDGRSGRLDQSSGRALKSELYAYYGERCGLQ